MVDDKNINCTGCKLCKSLCKNNAISFEENEEGFWYPRVDKDKCIKCKICINGCPALEENKEEGTIPKVFSAWSKNKEVRHKSTSGGIFWELASEIIRRDGVVFGAEYNENWQKVKHAMAENLDSLENLRGSKYFQSDTEDIYEKVKKVTQSDRWILYCGSPCQIAAMKKYLSEDYKKIIYMDFICLGINSPYVYRKYIKELETKNGSRVKSIQFKNKKNGWTSLATKIKFENCNEVCLGKNSDPWLRGFIFDKLFFRKSCYDCMYRQIPHKYADITVGDFWGIKGIRNYDKYEGVSAVIINSDKGEELFNGIRDYIEYKEKNIDDLVPGNPALIINPVIIGDRKKFFDSLKRESYENALAMAGKQEGNKHLCIKDDIDIIKKYKREISIIKYIYYNYFCKAIKHNGSAKIIPFKNTIIDIGTNAVINLNGNSNVIIGCNKLNKSKAETYIKLYKDATWNINNGASISYLTTIEIEQNAKFECGYFSTNVGCVIVVSRDIVINDDVMMGRNVYIYDSDFHQMLDCNNKVYNIPQKVEIGGHVWLTNNLKILKGSKIGHGSIVSSYSQVRGEFPPNSLIGQDGSRCKVIKNPVTWSREEPFKYAKGEKKLILFGYNDIGVRFYDDYREDIKFIVDNNKKSDGVVTFEQFYNDHKHISKEYVWVIASANYSDEIYRIIRDKYPENEILSV